MLQVLVCVGSSADVGGSGLFNLLSVISGELLFR